MAIKIRERELSSGETSFYLDIYFDGQRWTETVDGIRLRRNTLPEEKKSVKEALEKIRSKRQIELFNKEHGFKSEQRDSEDFLKYFEKVKNKKAKKTGEIWSNTLKYLTEYSKGKVRFKDLSRSWIEGFIEHLQKNLAPNSVRTYYQKFTAALNQAVKEEIILRNPANCIESPKGVEVEKNFLSTAELQIIYKVPFFNDDVKRAFLFSAYTGLRITDIKNLTWNEITEVKEGKKRVLGIKFRQQKTSSINYLPLNETAIKLMGKRRMPEDKIFKLSKHSKSVNRTFQKLFKKTGINKKITLHCARHTNATLLLSAGADLYTVSKLLGHKDIKSTQVYAKVVDRLKTDAVNKIPSLKL